MAYDVEKFQKLCSLEVPYKIALALSDDESPLTVAPQEPGVAVDDVDAEGEIEDVITTLNALLASLRGAGLLESE